MTAMKQTPVIIMHNAGTEIFNNIDSITQTNDVDFYHWNRHRNPVQRVYGYPEPGSNK